MLIMSVYPFLACELRVCVQRLPNEAHFKQKLLSFKTLLPAFRLSTKTNFKRIFLFSYFFSSYFFFLLLRLNQANRQNVQEKKNHHSHSQLYFQVQKCANKKAAGEPLSMKREGNVEHFENIQKINTIEFQLKSNMHSCCR